MAMEQIMSSTVSTFRTILYWPPHLLMSFIDRHILMLTIATYIQLDRLSTKGTEEPHRNELQLQKLHSNIW